MSLIACRQILAVARILLKFLPDFLNSTVRFALSPLQVNAIFHLLGDRLQINFVVIKIFRPLYYSNLQKKM